MQSPTYAKNKRACEFWIRGTGRGILEHPQHSLPPNTTCLYHMQGIDTSGPTGRNIIYRRPSFSAPRFRVWFSVLKFYVTNALNPNLPEDEYCGSHLNIWDGPMRISPGCSDIFWWVLEHFPCDYPRIIGFKILRDLFWNIEFISIILRIQRAVIKFHINDTLRLSWLENKFIENNKGYKIQYYFKIKFKWSYCRFFMIWQTVLVPSQTSFTCKRRINAFR